MFSYDRRCSLTKLSFCLVVFSLLHTNPSAVRVLQKRLNVYRMCSLTIEGVLLQIEVRCEFCKRDYVLKGKELEDAYDQAQASAAESKSDE